MKRFLHLAIVVFSLVSLSTLKAFADDVSLVISLENGTTVTCSFAKKPQMTFTESTLTLTTTEGAVGSWQFTEVDSWHFTQADPSGIKDTQVGNAISISNGEIRVNSNEYVCIYDLSGKTIKTQHVTAGSE